MVSCVFLLKRIVLTMLSTTEHELPTITSKCNEDGNTLPRIPHHLTGRCMVFFVDGCKTPNDWFGFTRNGVGVEPPCPHF